MAQRLQTTVSHSASTQLSRSTRPRGTRTCPPQMPDLSSPCGILTSLHTTTLLNIAQWPVTHALRVHMFPHVQCCSADLMSQSRESVGAHQQGRRLGCMVNECSSSGSQGARRAGKACWAHTPGRLQLNACQLPSKTFPNCLTHTLMHSVRYPFVRSLIRWLSQICSWVRAGCPGGVVCPALAGWCCSCHLGTVCRSTASGGQVVSH
jgi:hypothetical protein